MLKGQKHTEETKIKISEAHTGKPSPMLGKHLSEESKRKISESRKGKYAGEKSPNWGKVWSEESKIKIGNANRNPSKETRRKMSEAHIGYKHTEESKRKLSEAGKGRHHTAETLKKLSERQLGEKHHYWGKHLSKEHRRKISEAGKGLQAGEKNPMYGRTGEKSPFWKGGKSFEPYSPEFNRQLKELIRKRDNYRCKECFKRQKDNTSIKGKYRALNVHHIDYNKLNCMPNNLLSLCDKCHRKTNYKREYWTKHFNSRYNNSQCDSDSARTAN